MNTRAMDRERDERALKVAVCVKTFFNLYGKKPEIKDMVSWLGNEYLIDIMRFRREEAGAGAVCA